MNNLSQPPSTIYLSDYQPPAFLIETTHLLVEIFDDHAIVTATLQMCRNPDAAHPSTALELHGQELQLQSLQVNGVTLSAEQYAVTEDGLTIHGVPDRFELTSTVRIHPKDNTSLEGLYRSRTMYCTQCEAEGFRKITYYLDRPDVMSVFTTTVVADKHDSPILLSNGNLEDSGEYDDGRHWKRWHDPHPKPAYLFALVAGDLAVREDSFITCGGREVSLQLFMEPKDLDKADHAITSLKNAMRWDEEVYGREYDLDLYMIVAVDDFNMGAMENKGLNIFNTSCVLAHPQTTTDDGFKRVEAVVAHEYFHNWSGNRVTCRDWFQLSLKEGFTVFRDAEFSADMGSRTVKRVEDVNVLRTAQFAEDAGPTSHPVQPASYMEISNFYTLTIYEKGAEVVRMLHTLLGAEKFREGSDLYFQRHDGQAVTIEDFVAAMADVSGRDLSQFMHWYRQAGTPELTVSGEYDAQAEEYRLTFTQRCGSAAQSAQQQQSSQHTPFVIPVAMGLVAEQGDLPLDAAGNSSTVLEITEPQQTVVFKGIKQKPVPSLLRGFSAPVKLQFDYSLDELAFLMGNDSDGFNRWNAGQQLASQLINTLIGDFQQDKLLVLNPCLAEAFARVLSESNADPAMQALVMTLPSELLLAEQADTVDVNAIHHVRHFVRQQLADKLYPQWLETYQRFSGEPYSPTGDAMAARSLKNLALHYLLSSGHTEAIALAQKQFNSADNMTDRLSALSGLVNVDSGRDAAEQALQQFYDDWKDEPLVVNQWLQVQAACSHPGGLERVKSLMLHPAFELKNPNKARSLIGVFCHRNLINFHREDGEGYRFLADNILALDKLNPQIASRLLNPLTKWRRYNEQRQQLMKTQLERICSTERLSRDSYEIASKSL